MTARMILATIVFIAAACSSSDNTAAPETTSCEAPTAEALDPSSGVHVLDASSVQFDDPTPTSGPHVPALGQLGVLDEPALPASQVAILEQGGIVISARNPEALSQASELADPDELIAIQQLDGITDDIVVTAWRSRVVCSSYDAAYIEWFIANRVGRPDLNPEHTDADPEGTAINPNE